MTVYTHDIRHASIGELAAARADGAMVVDVREPWEYEQGHVPGARLHPLGRLAALAAAQAPGETVYVICQSGHRSRQACASLRAAGWDARSVAGGTSAWQEAGLPVVTGPHAHAA
jgi:rhodanese-related sulfurtransferase